MELSVIPVVELLMMDAIPLVVSKLVNVFRRRRISEIAHSAPRSCLLKNVSLQLSSEQSVIGQLVYTILLYALNNE